LSSTQVVSSTVEQVLVELSDAGSSGCLTVTDPAGEQAEVYFKDGLIYSVFVPGRRAQLGARLIASGDLSPEALTSALDVQTNELQGWRLGELLVHLGYVERPVVEAFVVEQLRDAMAALLDWPVAAHKFRKSKKTRQDVAPPSTVRDLLAEVEMRRHKWSELISSIGGQRGVPLLSARPDGASDVVLSSADWALLCKVDGVRDIAELAAECGFTVYEAAHVVQALMNGGLIDVELPDDEPVASVTSLEDARGKRPAFEPAPDPAGDELAGAVKKVTAALGDLFKTVTPPGPGTSLAEAAAALEADAEMIDVSDEPEIDEEALAAEKQIREAEERLSSEVEAWLEHEAWLAEQAKSVEADAWQAHASWLAEQRAAAEGEAWLSHYQWLEDERRRCESSAWVEHEEWTAERQAAEAIHLEAERKAMEHKAWKDHKTWLANERKRVEPDAWNDHQTWMDADRVRVEAEAWEAHGAVLEAERRDAEGAAWKAHAKVLEAERRAAEDEAWQVHAKYLEWHRTTVEAEAWVAHLVWLESERVRVEAEAWDAHAAVLADEERERAEEAEAAEKARLARLAAEQAELQRLEQEARQEEERRRRRQEEADKAAAEEAARLEAEAAAKREAEEAAERERLAAEEAARLEAEAAAEQARQEAEAAERERIAAEQAAERERAEAELAAEQARQEAEAAAERERAAAEEAARIEAEAAAERARIEAEEAARVHAEEMAAEAERQRLAAELAEAEAPTTAESFADLGNDPVPAPEPLETAEVVEIVEREAAPSPEPSVDTAALLRELASLGGFGESAGDSEPTVSSPVRSSPVTKDTDKKKKKKGMFGR
jgi:hypothetical protein